MTEHRAPSSIPTPPCRACGARTISVDSKGEAITCDWPPVWLTPDKHGAIKGLKRNGERITGYRVDGIPEMPERRAALHDLFLVVTQHECPNAEEAP